MRINADYAQRAASHGDRATWTTSPSAGVERRMLDRIGDEVARATTIVRFAPGSAFPEHVHGGGEEYFVLEGDFVDEEGSHKAGTYVRNPAGSRHSPSAPEGATIFVKLNQFAADDLLHVVVDASRWTGALDESDAAVERLQLHAHGREVVRLEAWRENVKIDNWGHGGLELLVLDGNIAEGGTIYGRYSWLRLPPHEPLVAQAGPGGVRMLVKSGHLAAPTRNGRDEASGEDPERP